MRRSQEIPRTRSVADAAEQGQSFDRWVGTRQCLFVADCQCRGALAAVELDFEVVNAPIGRDPNLIPTCEGHRGALRSIGWDKFLRDGGLNRVDLTDAASLLRTRWSGQSALSPDPSHSREGSDDDLR
jgi:hypothetical protein